MEKKMFLVKVRINLVTLKAFGQALQANALDRSSIRGETFCLQGDPAVGYSVWEAESREELGLKFAPWNAFYETAEIHELITPQEAFKKLCR
jgi:hypothetical protein